MHMNFVLLSLGQILKFHVSGFVFVSRKICSLGGKLIVVCNFRRGKDLGFHSLCKLSFL